MKLVSFGEYEKERVGVVVGDEIVDLASADASLPTTVLGILEAHALPAVAAGVDSGKGCRIAASSVRLGAPITRPSKIVCVGLNYRDHAEETNSPLPENPLLFSKASSAVIGPNDDVVLPADSQEVDYEVELAVVIGRRAKDVPLELAYDFIAGYAVANDVSARDVQFRQKQWHQGKSYDTFFPFGPYLVTRDEIADPNTLHVQFDLNGRTLQNSNTDNLIFNVPTLVSHISRIMTLYPGDVISTGTPAGVGVFRNPKILLKPGDDMVTTIDGLGTLRNRVK
ncbi:MAG: fumarylacetoacetate hydrolase family protein [candidate division Zixibacteria bacterium]|nr:fumarylacetoacetate hydrolase family protein [candidate division Zixibacteria bacterium]